MVDWKEYQEAQRKLNQFWRSMAALVESTPSPANATHSAKSGKNDHEPTKNTNNA